MLDCYTPYYMETLDERGKFVAAIMEVEKRQVVILSDVYNNVEIVALDDRGFFCIVMTATGFTWLPFPPNA